MATIWTETTIIYNIAAAGPNGLEIKIPFGPQDEADIDTAMEAFISAYNDLHAVSSVSKTYTGTGVSDWTP